MTKEQAIKKIVKASKELESVYCNMRAWNTYNKEADQLWFDIRMKLIDAQVKCCMSITQLEQQSFWK